MWIQLIMKGLISAFITLIFIHKSLCGYIFDAVIGQTSIECDYWRYKYGCEDTIGSVCVSGHCECKQGYTVRLSYGHCLKPLSIGERCISSSQCTARDNNSECFYGNSEFEWWCRCKPNYFHDSNNTLLCVKKFNFGQQCNASEQCLGDNSVCDRITSKCVCDTMFNYNFANNRCTQHNNTECDDGFEWNKYSKMCEHNVLFPVKRKGGGRGGGGRGGGGSRSGSRAGSRGSGFYASKSNAPNYVVRSGGYYTRELVAVKWTVIVSVIVTIIVAFFYFSCKLKRDLKDDKQFYEHLKDLKTQSDKHSPQLKVSDRIRVMSLSFTNPYNAIRYDYS